MHSRPPPPGETRGGLRRLPLSQLGLFCSKMVTKVIGPEQPSLEWTFALLLPRTTAPLLEAAVGFGIPLPPSPRTGLGGLHPLAAPGMSPGI